MKLLLIEDEELAVKKNKKTLMALDPNLEIVGTTDSIAFQLNGFKTIQARSDTNGY